jgi:putative flippase GtrA
VEPSLPGVVIPAYQPDAGLVQRVQALLAESYPFVVVVDDGSSQDHRGTFERLSALDRVEVLTHAANLGKGSALKTALNHVLVSHPEGPGVVVADADGQHLPHDVLRVAQSLAAHPDKLCLGVRGFEGRVPWRSRLGNASSRLTMRLVSGLRLGDTQSGLRGIPRIFLRELLPLRTTRYEFELEMLMLAGERRLEILQIPITTVYTDDNAGSHFNPILDSLRVYWVFLRFLVSSMLTALIDLIVFVTSYAALGSLLPSIAIGRLVAGTFNFLVNKRIVFKARRSYRVETTKYVLLVLVLMLISYQLTLALIDGLGVPVVLAKMSVDTLLFLVSFAAQRIYVFASVPGTWLGDPSAEEPTPATSWDAYYERPGRMTRFTRPITGRLLRRCLRYYRGPIEGARLLEFGGGNSCFFDAIAADLVPAHYAIADTNPTGRALFESRLRDRDGVSVHDVDVLDPPQWSPLADVCFSVGLIEHFDERGTRRAIRSHFAATRPGGLVVLFFPTATWLYRVARRMAEALRVWSFPDERPLGFDEVLGEAERHGRVLYRGINWWILFTQGMLAIEVADGAERTRGAERETEGDEEPPGGTAGGALARRPGGVRRDLPSARAGAAAPPDPGARDRGALPRLQRKRLEAADHAGAEPLGRRRARCDLGEAIEQGIQREAPFEARQARAQAEVHAEAEAQVPGLAAIEVVGIRRFEGLRVPVGGAVGDDDAALLRNPAAPDLHLARRLPAEVLDGAVEAHGLL